PPPGTPPGAAPRVGGRLGYCWHSARPPIAEANPRHPSSSWASSNQFRGDFLATHTRPDLGKGRVTAQGRVIKEIRESAVVGRSKLLDRDVLGRLQHTVPHLFRGLNVRVYRSIDSNENPLLWSHMLLNDLESLLR